MENIKIYKNKINYFILFQKKILKLFPKSMIIENLLTFILKFYIYFLEQEEKRVIHY